MLWNLKSGGQTDERTDKAILSHAPLLGDNKVTQKDMGKSVATKPQQNIIMHKPFV